jgi:hypothetical protein
MSHHAIELQQAALLLKRVSAAASEVESKVYEWDTKFQEFAAPTVLRGKEQFREVITPWLKEAAFNVFIYSIIAMVYALELGGNTREWFDQWLAEYVISAIEPELAWDYLALEEVQITEVTCPVEVVKPIKKEKRSHLSKS